MDGDEEEEEEEDEDEDMEEGGDNGTVGGGIGGCKYVYASQWDYLALESALLGCNYGR